MQPEDVGLVNSPELDLNNLEVTHAASASGLPPLGLNRPVV